MKVDSVLDLIGDTPLVRIPASVTGLRHIDLYAKLEMLNPFGSVKDRAAKAMVAPRLQEAADQQRTVIELSSGNTAKALAVIASMHGLPFTSITNRMKVPEIKDLLVLLGARIEELPGQAECLDPTDTDDPLARIHQQISADKDRYLHTDQYFNERNIDAHVQGTGPEIVADLGGAPDHFIACVGTAGSSTGVARVLRRHRDDVDVHGLVAAKGDFVPGIRTWDEVHEVGLFDPANYDSIASVSAEESLDGMMTLIRRCGILSGPTGGGAYSGAIRHLADIDDELDAAPEPERRTAVFIVCDRAESYLGYVRNRRPSLLAQPEPEGSVTGLSADELAAVPAHTVQDAQDWIARDSPTIIDLRTSFAFRNGHIEGSINIVDEVFGDLLRSGLPIAAEREALLVCPVGDKSRRYAAAMRRLGHHRVRSLDGGIVAWRDAGAGLARVKAVAP
ncbi:pyridoxal-phosphate dependent enzyme [Mycolicibacterium neoaurum]|uniref:pyridoxal-phosphate dependent enzyme n=1 Tax=Mycolicibacterium neoaurum TaxID=1795 RepID=UPI0026741B62|nr:pyridoxal-phosphate dependent enzyme [Mycolicibacterium neoaurum]MDO3399916.1 pyridoxal-phosphate dependent enzyme [Mycolicibacterium neoaurum]